ncbi:hypothetical protein M405DRAFT_262518 [Rhizopogon salebrosus TDB-379]|nr:hypothetical protein M405DRAFT_262518 [Rhizopogon salebrosus TDB-379]
MQVHSKHSLRKHVYGASFNSVFPFVGQHPATIRKFTSMTPDVYIRGCSSLVCRRTRQKTTCHQTHLIMIRSQTCIGARRSCATARAGLMANRGCLRDGFWNL